MRPCIACVASTTESGLATNHTVLVYSHVGALRNGDGGRCIARLLHLELGWRQHLYRYKQLVFIDSSPSCTHKTTQVHEAVSQLCRQITASCQLRHVSALIITRFPGSDMWYVALVLQSDRLTVGLTGYPNVGKSSTINALFGSKKTAVAPTPGKTKHFQTLNITDKMTLCDCPGLVLPRYAQSKSEMVAAGVLLLCLSPPDSSTCLHPFGFAL